MDTQGNSPVPDIVYMTHSALQAIQGGECQGDAKACGILIGRRLENEDRIELLIVAATGPLDTPPTIEYVNEALRKAQETYPNVGYMGTWYTHSADAPEFSQQEIEEAHGIFAEPAYRVREIINPIVLAQADATTIHYYYMNRTMASQRQPFSLVSGETIKEIPDDDPLVINERQAEAPAEVAPPAPASPAPEEKPPEDKPSPIKAPDLSNVRMPSALQNLGMPTVAGIALGILVVLIIIVVLVSQSGKQVSLLEEIETSLDQPSEEVIANAEYELSRFQHEGVSGRIAEKVADVYVKLGNVYLDQEKLDHASVSYDDALAVVPGYEPAQQGNAEISKLRNTAWCERAEKAEDGERISILESLVLNGFTECPQGPTLDLLYQTRLDYALELFEAGELAHAEIVAEEARVLVEEFAPSDEVAEMMQVLDILDLWGVYEAAALAEDWGLAVEALDQIIAITGPTPDPASFPAEKYGNRITEVANIRADAQLNYAMQAQLAGNLDTAEEMITSVVETEAVTGTMRWVAQQRETNLSLARKLWDQADAAMQRGDLNGVLQILRQIREIPGFSDLARNPYTGQTIEGMMRLINVIMIQQTMQELGMEETPQPPVIIAPVPLPPAEGIIPPEEVVPDEGNGEAAPEEGDAEAAPEEGDADAAPEEGDTDAAPEEGDTEAAPEEGDTEAAPEEGNGMSEEPEAAPEEGDTEAAPEEGDTEAAPEEDDTEAAPEEGNTEAAPEEGDTEAAPEEGDTEAAPEEGDTEAAPEEGNSEGDTEAAPEEGNSEGDAEATPEEGVEVVPW